MQSVGDLSIGQVAVRIGLSVPTIHYCEAIGLVQRVARREGGHRHYSPDELGRLIFIAHCRDLGFTLVQIRSLLDVTVDNRPCADARSIAEGHLAAVDAKIVELTSIRRHLEGFVTQCLGVCAESSAVDCSMIYDLSNLSTRGNLRSHG